jgi:ribonuclease P protein subunit RPR2
MARRHQRSDRRQIAGERIRILFAQAAIFFPENAAWSDRCITIARKIAMKERVRIPRDLSISSAGDVTGILYQVLL